MRVDPAVEKYLKVLNAIDDQNFIYMVSYVLICAGAFVLVVGFLGCCGALKECKWMLGLVRKPYQINIIKMK